MGWVASEAISAPRSPGPGGRVDVSSAGRSGGRFACEPDREWSVLDLGYRHVDVFSRRALRGNGLVVVLDAEHLSAEVMHELTREARQFETAFLTGVDLPGRSARLRIFAEDEELDFAGHPVLGAAAVLHTLLPAPDAEESWALAVAQRTVEVRTRGADQWVDVTMDQGVPRL